MTRIGLPNLVAQSAQVARSRGSEAGAERAAQAGVALRLVREADRRAAELERAGRTAGTGRRRRGDGEPFTDATGADGSSSRPTRHLPGEDDAPGSLLDVRA